MISGQVIDGDSLPLPYVHVYVEDRTIGTITNWQGYFELFINKELRNGNLQFSAIGYIKVSMPISAIGDSIRVVMKEAVWQLKGITIRPTESDSARAILYKAIGRIKHNYSDRLYYLDGFYREVSYKDSLATRLIEAAIRINSKAYQFDKETLNVKKMKIGVEQVRKSNDYRTYTLWDEVASLIFGKENNLYKIFKEDYVRYINKNSSHFLGARALRDYYQYELKDVIIQNNDTVYVVHAGLQTSLTVRDIDFYINARDWAFLKIEHSLRYNYQAGNFTNPDLNPLIKKATTIYNSYRGKYYLNLIDVINYANGATPILDNNQMQFDQLQFMTNNIHTKHDPGFEKIKKREAESSSEDIYAIDKKYDEQFWQTYTMLLYAPLKDSVATSLEREEKLIEQFRKNE